MHINPTVDKIERKIAALTSRHKKSSEISFDLPKASPRSKGKRGGRNSELTEHRSESENNKKEEKPKVEQSQFNPKEFEEGAPITRTRKAGSSTLLTAVNKESSAVTKEYVYAGEYTN